MTVGVYYIYNRRERKYYIGSSLHIEHRINTHFCALRGGKHSNQYLQQAWDKDGEKAFIWGIFEKFDVADERPLRQAEQAYLNRYQPYRPEYGYNKSDASTKSMFQRTRNWRRRHGYE